MYSNRDLLAKTLEAEAGNQGLGGMLAVGSVIANRLGTGQSWRDVILAPGQFSAWNSVTGYAGGEQGQDMEAIKPSKDAYAAADAILSGNYADITGGATHYYNPDISQPSWGASAGGEWKRIGAHVFGKADAPRKRTASMDGQQPTAMQPTAQQMQQMQQQPRGLMGFLRDPRTREVLTSLSRSEVGRRLGEIAKRDRELQIGRENDNKTAQWLMTQQGGKPYADAILSGALTGAQAYSQWNQDRQRSGTKIGDKLIDPVTGEVIYEPDPDAISKLTKDQNSIVNNLNSSISKVMKPYQEIFNSYGLISRAIANQQSGRTSGINDLVVSIAFAKILDPESVVRTEEAAAVSAAGGGMSAAFGQFKNFLDGQGALPANVRTEIMNTTQQTANTWYKIVSDEYDRAMKQAELSGIPKNLAEQVLMKPTPPQVPPLPPVEDGGGDEIDPNMPNGVIPQSALDADLTQEDWNKMNKDEIKPFL